MMASPNFSENIKKKTEPKKSVVKGKFPEKTAVYPKPAVLKVNIMLAFCLAVAVVLSMVSYLAVIAKENRIKDLHTSTNKINYENIELQNKVDYLKSFYTIDDKVQKIDFLKKADKVMEVSKKSRAPLYYENKEFFDVTSVSGF